MVRIKVLQGHLPSAQVIWSILLQLILISVVFLLVLIYDLLKDRRIDNVTINQISPFSYMKQIVSICCLRGSVQEWITADFKMW